MRVERDFRKSPWVQETPQAVHGFAAGKDDYVVWRDEIAGKLGFADASYAVIADAAEAVRLDLQNVSPGKGGGYAQLLLVDGKGKQVKVGETDYRGFDAMAAEVASMMGLPLETLTEYNDS